MIVTHKLKLDLANWELPPRIDVMQGDKYSRNLEIQLYENKRELPLSEISNVLVRYVKPDHTGGTYDTLPDGSCAWSICENALQIAIAPQVCTAPGLVQMVVCICSGDAELNSFLLELQVQKLPKGICSSHPYVNIKGFVPQPETAQIGQYLKVKEVDQFGKVTAVETTAISGSSSATEHVVTCNLKNTIEDDSVVPVNADTLAGELPEAFAKAEITKAFCRAKFPADAALTNTYAPWPMAIALQAGDFWAIEDGALVCKKACFAEVSLQVLLQTGFSAGDGVHAYIYRNDSIMLRLQYRVPNSTLYATIATAPYTVDFSAGDRITVRVKNDNGERGIMKNYSNCSYLNIKPIASINETGEVSA